MRHLLLFFALGGALLGVKRQLIEAEPVPQLVVVVPAQASAPEVERAIDEAVLVDQALVHGGALIDPVVREQLLRSMRIGPGAAQGSDAQLLERALSLGLPRADPLVRQRLAFQAQQVLRAGAQLRPPTDAVLATYLQKHAARYREPQRFSFVQVFVSRARRGEQLEQAADAIGEQLRRDAPNAEAAHRYGDPGILPRKLARASARDVDARFGQDFAEAVSAVAPGAWSGPIRSSYGLHFIHVSAVEPESLPALSEIRARVLSDHDHDRREAALHERLRELRAAYRIELRRQQP